MNETTKQALQDNRLNKQLDQKFIYSGKIMSRREYLESKDITRVSATERKYSKNKINGCYAELKKPRIEYTAWYNDPLHGS